MAKESKDEAVTRVSKPPANEFFRGDEKQYHGGNKSIVSPVGSIFDAVSVSKTNAMDRALAEQGGGQSVGDTNTGGRRKK